MHRMFGNWKSATIANGGTLSAEVDLGEDFARVLVILPTITSETISIRVATGTGGTFVPVHAFDADATGSFLHASTAGTGGIALVFFIGGAQFIQIESGGAQGAERVISVRGC